MGMKYNKKGVSPLLATVLLIGFAVSIGAVIMSWGKTAFEQTQNQTAAPPVDEGAANLAWYMGSNIEGLCYTDDQIRMTLKGSPSINIKSVFVGTEGRNDYVVADPINFPTNPNENIDVKIPYDRIKYGDISKLIVGAVDTAIITNTPQRCSS